MDNEHIYSCILGGCNQELENCYFPKLIQLINGGVCSKNLSVDTVLHFKNVFNLEILMTSHWVYFYIMC